MNVCPDPRSRQTEPRRRRGQSLTEAAVITFLVAVGTIGLVGLFGDNLRHLFGASADAIAGSTHAPNGGTQTNAGMLKWSLKGSDSGGMSQNHGYPGATSNATGTNPGGIGNPGGTANSAPAD